jgi:nitrile hydratase
MDGIHDLGGRHGFGASLEQRDDSVFHARWERRVFALASLVMAHGCYNTDEFRHAIERIDPAAYLSDGYFGRWLGGVELLVAESADHPQPGRYTDPTARRSLDRAPRFCVGDTVTTRNLHPPGHTRLPGYARARRGRIALLHGAWVLPDTHAHGLGESPEPVYAVRFDGRELWGEAAEPDTCVHIDLFERYLEPL